MSERQVKRERYNRRIDFGFALMNWADRMPNPIRLIKFIKWRKQRPTKEDFDL